MTHVFAQLGLGQNVWCGIFKIFQVCFSLDRRRQNRSTVSIGKAVTAFFTMVFSKNGLIAKSPWVSHFYNALISWAHGKPQNVWAICHPARLFSGRKKDNTGGRKPQKQRFSAKKTGN